MQLTPVYPAGKKNRRAGVPKALLVGPTDAGKTALFAKVRSSPPRSTLPPPASSINNR